MKLYKTLIESLSKSPEILSFLVSNIPEDQITERRLKGRWSVHEQVCHLVDAQKILMGRFRQFEKEENTHIRNYDPGEEIADDYYLRMDFHACLKSFPSVRSEMIEYLEGLPETYWNKQGSHDSVTPYSSMLLLNHTLNVDFGHFFSIEQLGLTKPGLEKHILSIP